MTQSLEEEEAGAQQLPAVATTVFIHIHENIQQNKPLKFNFIHEKSQTITTHSFSSCPKIQPNLTCVHDCTILPPHHPLCHWHSPVDDEQDLGAPQVSPKANPEVARDAEPAESSPQNVDSEVATGRDELIALQQESAQDSEASRSSSLP
ncbi:unnamed protein product [Penicillium palitans]